MGSHRRSGESVSEHKICLIRDHLSVLKQLETFWAHLAPLPRCYVRGPKGDSRRRDREDDECESIRPVLRPPVLCRKPNVIRSFSKGGDAEQSICLGLLDLLFLVLLRSGFGFCLALRARIEECIKIRLWLQRAASN